MIVALPDVLVFQLPVGAGIVPCRISYEGLARRTGLRAITRWEACQVFAEHQDAIEAEALSMHRRGVRPVSLN
jgi:hypothetical protein